MMYQCIKELEQSPELIDKLSNHHYHQDKQTNCIYRSWCPRVYTFLNKIMNYHKNIIMAALTNNLLPSM